MPLPIEKLKHRIIILLHIKIGFFSLALFFPAVIYSHEATLEEEKHIGSSSGDIYASYSLIGYNKYCSEKMKHREKVYTTIFSGWKKNNLNELAILDRVQHLLFHTENNTGMKNSFNKNINNTKNNLIISAYKFSQEIEGKTKLEAFCDKVHISIKKGNEDINIKYKDEYFKIFSFYEKHRVKNN